MIALIIVFYIIVDVYSGQLALLHPPRHLSLFISLIHLFIAIDTHVYQHTSIVLNHHPISSFTPGRVSHHPALEK